MWVLLLLAISITDPTDVPGEIQLQFNTYEECIAAAKTMNFKLKFPGFKVTTICKQY
jgi:hypothetical protein